MLALRVWVYLGTTYSPHPHEIHPCQLALAAVGEVFNFVIKCSYVLLGIKNAHHQSHAQVGQEPDEPVLGQHCAGECSYRGQSEYQCGGTVCVHKRSFGRPFGMLCSAVYKYSHS